jgi:hypothetical protein
MVGVDSNAIAVDSGDLSSLMLVLRLGTILRIRSVRTCAVGGTRLAVPDGHFE